MEEQVTLKKVFGDMFFTAERMEGNAFIYSQWYGVQSVETVKEGGYKLLEMLKEQPCSKLLNSNKQVIGSWDMALEWAETEWAPLMRAAGLKYLAQVVPSSIYATLTIEKLIQQIDDEFEIRTFQEDADAETWLLSLVN
ncbi:hypothetical protein [Pontibacter pamirensis]|uniref:hypothetical protein n=1 Tax=Pontibacter pamirensis TaxID=2562824 RepID=UPI00138A1827|nr:hypothetical protein [Pontibacter pamirensis]